MATISFQSKAYWKILGLLSLVLGNLSALQAQDTSLRWGLINKSGEIIAPFDYYINVNTFSNGLCAVQSQSKRWGYINNQGNTVIPFEFDQAEAFENGIAIVGKNRKKEGTLFGIIDYKGKEILPINYKTVSRLHKNLYIYGNKKLGLLDQNGNVVVKPMFDEILPNSYGSGLIPVKKNGLWGYLDEEGNMALDFQFYQASPFVKGAALVRKKQDDSSFISIDREGKELYKFPYSEKQENYQLVRFRQDGYVELTNCQSFDQAGTCTQSKVSLLAPNGTTEVPFDFMRIQPFQKGAAIVYKSPTQVGVINLITGNSIPCLYQEVFLLKNDKCIAIGEKDSLFLLNETGEVLQNLGPHQVKAPSQSLLAAAMYDIDNTANPLTWGFLDFAGKWMIPQQFLAVKSFQEGAAPVQDKSGKWGFVDSEGSILIPFQYEQAQHFVNNVAWVAKKID